MDLTPLLLDVAKVAGGATLGVWAAAWNERRKRKTHREELQALLLAEVGALREAARRAREWHAADSSRVLVLHLERVIRCFDTPDFVVNVATDNWMRKQLLYRYQRFAGLKDRLASQGAVLDDDDLALILEDWVFDNVERTNRWRRAPVGTRYTSLLEKGKTTELRWYHAFRWLRLWRIVQRRKREKANLGTEMPGSAVETPNTAAQPDV